MTEGSSVQLEIQKTGVTEVAVTVILSTQEGNANGKSYKRSRLIFSTVMVVSKIDYNRVYFHKHCMHSTMHASLILACVFYG